MHAAIGMSDAKAGHPDEALFDAVKRGDADTVQELLLTGQASPNLPHPDGHPPLYIALAEGHGQVVEVLLKNGADYSHTDTGGNTPLHVVTGKGNYEALKVFLKNVQLPEINSQNQEGETALMVPASRGYSIIVECLLQNNTDPNIPNRVGRTPIMAAASRGHKEVIKVLLKYGANILLTSYEDFSGMPTALREALANGSPDVTAFVTHSCSKAVETIKRLFTCKTREETVGLIKSGCNMNQRRGDGSTPLMIHATSGNVAVVICLLEEHAFMDAQDKSGQTALMKSSFYGKIDVVKLIVTKGALINIKCKLGRTALMYGVMGESFEVAKHLILSGADATIRDHNGLTAEELAKQRQLMKIHTYLKEKSPASRTDDPFTVMLSEYLHRKKAQSTSEPEDVQQTAIASSTSAGSWPNQQRRQTPSRPDERMAGRQEGAERSDQRDALTQQLHIYIRRVAELETRVEELTICADFSLMDEEDLSYYKDQPDRLIDEFKKMKATKKRAEQFAIEAKQSAQKASVELSRVKEDLIREKHGNELRLKSMVADMEKRVVHEGQRQSVLEEKQKTSQREISKLKDIIRAYEGQRSEEISQLKDVQRRLFSPKEVFQLIVNGEKKTRFKVTLVAVTGLPDSGKTTLIQKLIPNTTKDKNQEMTGLAMFEIGFSTTSRDNTRAKWEEFKREDIYMFMLARALAEETQKSEQLPALEEWFENKLPGSCFSSLELRTQFRNMYIKMRNELLKFDCDTHYHIILKPSYVLLNVWDIGVSKALYESLPLLARMTSPLVLFNLLDLSRDVGEKLRQQPDLKAIHEEQSIMKGRSRAHYYVRIAGLCTNKGGSILIATHKDRVPTTDVQRMKRLVEAGIRAKAGDMGVDKSLHSEMLAIDVHNDDDCSCVKQCLEDLVNSSEEFNQDLRLSWIFLRTALIHYESESSDFLIQRTEFNELAQQCGLKTSQEIEDCLQIFTSVGSLLYHSAFFRDNIIYRPYNFFKKLNVLYDVDDTKDEHVLQSLKRGFLCRTVAADLWDGDKDFFWHLLQDTGVATQTSVTEGPDAYDFNVKCPHEKCGKKDCLFIPSIRKKRFYQSKDIKLDSLFITFNSEYVPADIQALFVRYIGTPSHIPGIQLKQTEYYNSTVFELPDRKGGLQVIVHGDVVEIVTDEIHESTSIEIKSVLKTLCVTVLNAVLKYFPGFEYQLGFICSCSKIEKENPPNRNNISYLHFLPSQYATHLLCRKCKKMIELRPGQLRWMRAPSRVPEEFCGHSWYEARIIGEDELVQITRLIPLDRYMQLCTMLGQIRPQSFSEGTMLAVLTAWQKASLCNRQERLAKILLNIGCYNAALKLDAKLIHVCQEEVKPRTSKEVLSEKELETICNFAVDWKKLATALHIPESRVREIEQDCRERDRCRRVLNSVPPTTCRTHLEKALRDIGWLSLAEGIACGYMDSTR